MIPLVASVVALLGGAALGLGMWFVAPGMLALAGLAVFVARPKWLLWLAMLGGLCGIGLLDLYLFPLRQLGWLFSMAGLVLGVVCLFQLRLNPSQNQHASSLYTALLIYVLAVVASGLLSPYGWGVFGSGLKGYLQALGIALGLLWVCRSGTSPLRVMNGLLVLTMLQVPFVLHQFIFLVPLRSSIELAIQKVVAVDIVAGTFGGVMNGGGRSPDMALLCVVGLTYALCQLRHGIGHKWLALGAVAASAMCFAMSEVKLIFVLLPIAGWMVYGDLIRTHPLKFAKVAGIGALALALVFIGYAALPGAASQRPKNLQAYFDDTVAYNFGNAGYGGADLNRTSVYRYWAVHTIGELDLVRTLVGYGPGATAQGNGQENLSSKGRFAGVGVGLTGASSLLWETGLLGLLSVGGIFAITMAKLRRSRKALAPGNPALWAYYTTLEVACISLGLGVLHSNYIVFDLPFQALWMSTVGLAFAQD
jgi:hypothetical protein